MSAEMKNKRPEKIYFMIYQLAKGWHKTSRDGEEEIQHAIFDD